MNKKTRSVKVNGIILRKTKHRETSLILDVLTKELGKIPIIAKGVRKEKNKNQGLFNVLYELELSLYKNPNSDWYILKLADLIKSHTYTQDFEVTILMQAAIEIYRQIIIPEDDIKELYKLLQVYLNYIKTVDKNKVAIFWRFLLRLFLIVGIDFNLSNCINCNKPKEYFAYFPQKHGFICDKCYRSVYEDFVFILSEDEKFIFSNLEKIGNLLDELALSRSTISQVNRIFLTHLSEHFHKNFYLRSLEHY